MMAEKRKPATPPSTEGTLHFDERGQRISMAEFAGTLKTGYTVSVAAMTAHLAAVNRWMRETTEEATC